MSNTLLYPNLGGVSGSAIPRDPVQAPDRRPQSGEMGKAPNTDSFENILNDSLARPQLESRPSLKFSAHAMARVNSRHLDIGPDQMRKLNEAVNKAAAKGLDDTLILTKDAAFIVSVKNRTIVTAMDRQSLENGGEGSVFTNIDGAVIA